MQNTQYRDQPHTFYTLAVLTLGFEAPLGDDRDVHHIDFDVMQIRQLETGVLTSSGLQIGVKGFHSRVTLS